MPKKYKFNEPQIMTKDYDDPLAKLVSGNIDLNWLTKEALRREVRDPKLSYNPNIDKTDEEVVKYHRLPTDKQKGIEFDLDRFLKVNPEVDTPKFRENFLRQLDAQDLADRETRKRRGIEEFKLPNKIGMDSDNPEYPYAPQLPAENKTRLERDPYEDLLQLLSKKR